ncbi:unnamed protein product [Sphagnum balticum]
MEQDNRTRSQRWSDGIAIFCGSWGFVFWFMAGIFVWIVFNAIPKMSWDEYPYTFLNLILTIVSTMQSPIIMMSQNRQAERDKEAERIQADRDREMVRELKAELSVMHEMLEKLLQK